MGDSDSDDLDKCKKESSMIDDQHMYVKFQVEVRDKGFGISEEDLANLFIDFGKLKDSQHQNVDGTGLGLSISKLIAEHLNGEVRVTSEVGEGSSFFLVMRAATNSRINLMSSMNFVSASVVN